MAKGSVSQAMKRVSHYLRNDFKEIVNPSAMPNPQWYKEKTKGTRKTSILSLVKASPTPFVCLNVCDVRGRPPALTRFPSLLRVQVVGTALGEYRKGWKHFLAGTQPDEAPGSERAPEDGGGGGDSEGNAAEDVCECLSPLPLSSSPSIRGNPALLVSDRLTSSFSGAQPNWPPSSARGERRAPSPTSRGCTERE